MNTVLKTSVWRLLQNIWFDSIAMYSGHEMLMNDTPPLVYYEVARSAYREE